MPAIETEMGKVTLFHLGSLENIGIKIFERLPYSIKVLLENVLRNCDGNIITLEDIPKIANWSPTSKEPTEIAFYPGRVLLQDFTGVPCVVDLAAMRAAAKIADSETDATPDQSASAAEQVGDVSGLGDEGAGPPAAGGTSGDGSEGKA